MLFPQKNPTKRIRINKYLVQAGVAASRRQAEELLDNSKCKIQSENFGEVPADKIKGYQVDPANDKVYIKDKLVRWRPREKIYLMMNKPPGYVCTRQDEHAAKTIFDLLPPKYKKLNLFSVGRLDKNSEGLLLLTNDGDWANNLMHPRYGHEKEYLVWLDGSVTPDKFGRLTAGMLVQGKLWKMKDVKKEPAGENLYRVILTEGHKRQIRVMFDKAGRTVLRLQRIREDTFELGDLPAGKVKEIKV